MKERDIICAVDRRSSIRKMSIEPYKKRDSVPHPNETDPTLTVNFNSSLSTPSHQSIRNDPREEKTVNITSSLMSLSASPLSSSIAEDEGKEEYEEEEDKTELLARINEEQAQLISDQQKERKEGEEDEDSRGIKAALLLHEEVKDAPSFRVGTKERKQLETPQEFSLSTPQRAVITTTNPSSILKKPATPSTSGKIMGYINSLLRKTPDDSAKKPTKKTSRVSFTNTDQVLLTPLSERSKLRKPLLFKTPTKARSPQNGEDKYISLLPDSSLLQDDDENRDEEDIDYDDDDVQPRDDDDDRMEEDDDSNNDHHNSYISPDILSHISSTPSSDQLILDNDDHEEQQGS